MQDELTLKELILAVQEYFLYFLGKWYWFVLGAVVVGGLFFWNAYTTPVTYTAPLTFLLNNDKEKSLGAGALLGSLGLGAPESGGGTAAKLLELGKSRQVLGRVLFDSATVQGKSQLIADHLIEAYDYHEEWENSEVLAGFLFNGKRPAIDNLTGNQVYKSLYKLLIWEEEAILSIVLDEFSGFFEIQATTPKAELSIAITEKVYAELSRYFISAAVSDKEESLNLLSERADSVQIALMMAEGRLARFEDRSSQIMLRQETVNGQKLKREVVILSTIYAEIIKNRETAAFLLANEKPVFELVDGPLEPLSPSKDKLLKVLVIGGLLGGILTGIVLFFSKLVRDALQS